MKTLAINYNSWTVIKVKMFAFLTTHEQQQEDEEDAQGDYYQSYQQIWDHSVDYYDYQIVQLASPQQQQIASDTVVQLQPIQTQSKVNTADNRQSVPAFTPNWNFKDVGQLKIFNSQMLKSDFTFLSSFWPNHASQFIDTIHQITSNWNIYRNNYEKPFQQFLHIFRAKVQRLPMFEQIYPGLTRMIEMIEKVEEIKGSIDMVDVFQDHKTDILYQHFVLAEQSKKDRRGEYFIKEDRNGSKKPIGEFIAQTVEFKAVNGWQDIFFKAKAVKQDEINYISSSQQKNRAQFIKSIEDGSPFVISNRLCCCTFFYHLWDVSDKSSKQQGNVLTRESAKSLGDDSKVVEVMLDICALLNSGGGVILFDTVRDGLQIMPKGASLTSKQIAQITKIENKLQNIYPSVKKGENVIIEWIPVLVNPYQEAISKQQPAYMGNRYVLRIKVVPSQAQRMYHYNLNDQQLLSAVVQKDITLHLEGKELVRMAKKRWNYFHVPQTDYSNQEEKALLQKNFRYIDHKCASALPGFNPLQKKQGPAQQLQKGYRYTSLLVAGRKYHKQIRELFLTTKYDEYKFKAASNSAMLFHNCPFDELLKTTVNNKNFWFDNRPTIVIFVTDFVKLVQKNQNKILPVTDFESLEKWINLQHPNQKLEVWRFQIDDNRAEFYVKTGSKISTIFMYYILNHYAEKAAFKNPKDLDKLSPTQREKRFKKFYPIDRSQK